MAFSRHGGGTALVAAGDPLNLTWPGSLTANMLAVVTMSFYEGGGGGGSNFVVDSPPSGFTERTNTVISGTGGDESRAFVYTKELVGSETGTLSIGFSGSTYAQAALDVYSGDGDLTFASLSAADTGSGTDATAPSVTGTAGQGLAALYCLDDPPGATNSGPSGMTLGADGTTTTNSVRTYWQALTSSGATGVKTWDFTNTRGWGGLALLINDAGGGGGPTELPPLVMAQMSPAGRR